LASFLHVKPDGRRRIAGKHIADIGDAFDQSIVREASHFAFIAPSENTVFRDGQAAPLAGKAERIEPFEHLTVCESSQDLLPDRGLPHAAKFRLRPTRVPA